MSEPIEFPATGYVRLKAILRFIPVSASTWWAGVRKGYYPKPVKLGPKMTAWRAEDIHEFFKTGVKF